jgi:hypothetical protein
VLHPAEIERMVQLGLLNPNTPEVTGGFTGAGMPGTDMATVLQRMQGQRPLPGYDKRPMDESGAPFDRKSYIMDKLRGSGINYMGRGQTFNVSPALQGAFARLFGRSGGTLL